MKLSLATIALCVLSLGHNADATLLRGSVTRRHLQQQQQGFTTTTVQVTPNTPTTGIPNCTPGQRVQFNAQTQQWECFNPLGAVVVGQGTNMQNIPDDANDIDGVDNGTTIIQNGGTTTVMEAGTTTSSSPGMSTPTTTSVTSPGVTTPANPNGTPITTGLSACTSGQRAQFNAQTQMWECLGPSVGGPTVTTVNGNAVGGGGNTVTVGTPPANNNPAFSATAPNNSDDCKKGGKKGKKCKSKKDSNTGNDFTLNGGGGSAGMEANVVPSTAGCATGQSAVYMPGDNEWRCVTTTGNPDMDP